MSETDTHAREPRADKVATVAEITTKLNEARAVFVTEYRGMSVPELADVRTALRPTDAQHVIYKNTLTKIAIGNTDDHLKNFLISSIAFTRQMIRLHATVKDQASDWHWYESSCNCWKDLSK